MGLLENKFQDNVVVASLEKFWVGQDQHLRGTFNLDLLAAPSK